MASIDDLDVALAHVRPEYSREAPFHPAVAYPEYPHGRELVSRSNAAYGGVRDAFRTLGLDRARFDTKDWNPLGDVVRPGDRVLVKPNLVLHANAGGGPLDAVVTHPSVIRAVVDYVLIALDGRGEIVVGDAPQANCDFDALQRATGLDVLAKWLATAAAQRGVAFRLADFRVEQTVLRRGIVWERRPLGGRPPIRVALGAESWMDGIDASRLYGADADRRTVAHVHEPGAHVYSVAPEALEADVTISIPKLKVHSKVGTTLNLKNMVGIAVDKNSLAHYRIGTGDRGGDERAVAEWDDRLERVLMDRLLGRRPQSGRYLFMVWKGVRKTMRLVGAARPDAKTGAGNWHGNDTAWRMALDMSRIARFARSDGSLAGTPARRFFSIVDGIVGGEGDGPLGPDAVPSGVVIAGRNPVVVDWIATSAMGIDPRRLPLYTHAVELESAWCPGFSIQAARVRSAVPEWAAIVNGEAVVRRFTVPNGWLGRIERTAAPVSTQNGRRDSSSRRPFAPNRS